MEVWEIEKIRDYVIAPALLIGFSVWILSGLWGWFKSGYNSSKKYRLLKGVTTLIVVLLSSFGVLYIMLALDWNFWMKSLLIISIFILFGYWSEYILKN